MKIIKKWQGVRYQLGGLSQDGIDCSGFVHIVYKKGLGKELPRTATQQSKLGKIINKNDLKPGDLIFFRTNKRSNHVGIYLENKKFIHASRSRGVTISRSAWMVGVVTMIIFLLSDYGEQLSTSFYIPENSIT